MFLRSLIFLFARQLTKKNSLRHAMAAMALLHVSNFVYKKFSQLSTKHNSLVTKITYHFRSRDMNLFFTCQNWEKKRSTPIFENVFIFHRGQRLTKLRVLCNGNLAIPQLQTEWEIPHYCFLT